MTLPRLLLAAALVSVWFLAAGWIVQRAFRTPPVSAPRARRRVALVTIGEAAVVTLFASLWFDSLGHGGWWLVFALLGVLGAFPRTYGVAAGRLAPHPALAFAAWDIARYLGAGALLAWRLR